MDGPALHVEGLSKSYGRLRALLPLDLDIPPGAVFALLGSNGAGKSTFMKCVLTLVNPDAGIAAIFGVDTRDPGSRARARYLPETVKYPGNLTPSILHAMLSRVRRSGSPRDLALQLERLGCPELLDRQFSRMSRGQLQRTAISLAFAGSPPLLFLDEPSNGLDPEARILLRTMVREHASGGGTAVINSHLLGEVEAVCDMAAFMKQGAIVSSGRVDEMVRPTGRARIGTTDPGAVAGHLAAAGWVTDCDDRSVTARLDGRGFEALVAHVAASGDPFHSVERERESLEELFMRLAAGGR
jgi:ABC-2 type transport system ATP-binding protein